MEDILAVTSILGGSACFIFSLSPIGRAIAARIRGDVGTGHLRLSDTVETVIEEQRVLASDNQALREEIADLHERLDFTERLLYSRGPEEADPKEGKKENQALQNVVGID